MKNLIVLLVLLSVIGACKKDKTVEYSSSIIGEWKWLSTCGGFSGGCAFPETNSTAKIVFDQDSIYTEYRNNLLIDSYKFSILSKPVEYTFGSLLINSKNYYYSIIRDTLNISLYGSEFSSMYSRIK